MARLSGVVRDAVRMVAASSGDELDVSSVTSWTSHQQSWLEQM